MPQREITKIRKIAIGELCTKYTFVKGLEGLCYKVYESGIAAVDLQLSDLGDYLYVNICWTFHGLPGFTTCLPTQPQDMGVLDYLFHDRLEQVSGAADIPPRWLEREREQIIHVLPELSAHACNMVAHHFSEPYALVERLPPDLLMSDSEESLANAGKLVKDLRQPAYWAIRSALHGFGRRPFSLAWSLHLICKQYGDEGNSAQYIVVARNTAWHEQEKRLVSVGDK